MLDLRRLRLLSELSRRGTIADVARAVGYTPSAISQSLAQLEREAGVALLERDGRRVRLTPAARGLVARTERMLAELDAAEAELAAEQATVRGPLVVGAFPSAGAALAAPALAALAARHPELECSVREHEPEDGIALLRAGELDLLVSETSEGVAPAPSGGLEQHELLTEELLLVLPASHPAPDPTPLELLADAPWISGLAGSQYLMATDRACRAAGFVPRVAHRADDQSLIHGLVRAGLGVALLPMLACTPEPGIRYTRPVPRPPRRTVTALARRGATSRPAVAAAVAALRHQLDQPRGADQRQPDGHRQQRAREPRVGHQNS